MTLPPIRSDYDRPSRARSRGLMRRLRRIMAEETAPQARLDQFVKAIAGDMVADVCSIYVRRADDTLELFATEGLKRSAVHDTRLNINEGLVGRVARDRVPVKVRVASDHPDFAFRVETGEEELQSFLGIPIVRSGQVIGVLVLQNKTPRLYQEDEIEVGQTVAMVLAEIVSVGDFLEERDQQDVEALLHKPEFAMGTPIVPGVALGVVVRHDPVAKPHTTFVQDVAAEVVRLEEALGSVQKSVENMIAADETLGGASREVLEVFRLFAYDKGWARRLTEKVENGLSAESAVEQVQDENRKRMRDVTDPYLRERLADLEDLSRRLIRALNGEMDTAQELPENAVLVAETLGPAELLELDRTHLRGLIVAEGGATSHAAIVARSLEVPMVSELPGIVEKATNGDNIVMDGGAGEVHLRPPETVITAFADKARLRSQRLARYRASRDEKPITLDGVAIDLQMNAGLLIDMGHLSESGASSVGLFRTEFQFLMGRSLPSASDQERFYRQVLDAADGKTVTFRTADIGSDKRAGYMRGPHEQNPAMGWRGLRMSLDREGLMRTQIRALLSAAGDRPLSVMLPLVTTPAEMREARALIDKELARHVKLVGTPPPSLRIGAMIEIPSAAWEIRRIAACADFMSIGGNDLAQFFFAADRDSENLSGRYDTMAPSFLSFLERTVREAKASGKEIGYCGEQAADGLMALALIAIGVTRLSVAASAIGPLREMIRTVKFVELREQVAQLFTGGGESIREPLRDYALKAGIELG